MASKRSKEKYPALKPELNLKSRYELIDQDYVHKLSEKEKEWLNRFNEEYINANMNHKGPKLHKTKELQKERYNANNSRNRCIYTKAKASGKLDYFFDIDIRNEPRNYSDNEQGLKGKKLKKIKNS